MSEYPICEEYVMKMKCKHTSLVIDGKNLVIGGFDHPTVEMCGRIRWYREVKEYQQRYGRVGRINSYMLR